MLETIPEGWGTRLHEAADFDASFEELDESTGFAAESLRGRCRSLAMFLDEADGYFKKAAAALKAIHVPDDTGQAALTCAYERENDLLLGKPARRVEIELDIPPGPKARAIESVHKSLEALELLHAGEASQARGIYRALCADKSEVGAERLALWAIGRAVCDIQENAVGPAMRWLEIAGFHVCDPACRTLGRAQLAARLSHVYAFVDRNEEAESWRHFLRRVRCPEKTKLAMRQRAELLSARSLNLGRCVLC